MVSNDTVTRSIHLHTHDIFYVQIQVFVSLLNSLTLNSNSGRPVAIKMMKDRHQWESEIRARQNHSLSSSSVVDLLAWHVAKGEDTIPDEQKARKEPAPIDTAYVVFERVVFERELSSHVMTMSVCYITRIKSPCHDHECVLYHSNHKNVNCITLNYMQRNSLG